MNGSEGSPAPASRLWRPCVGLMLLALAGWVGLPALSRFGPASEAESGPSASQPAARTTAIAASAEPEGGRVFRHAIPEPGHAAASQPHLPPEASGAPVPPAVAPGPAGGLPPVPALFGAPPPAFTERYRTTLRMPPPPLLDPRHPAPVVRSERVTEAAVQPRAASVHIVHDGDDLTGIALRFYGNPAMADAILSANRDRLGDPAILPIGMQLLLPAVAPPTEAAGLPAGRSAWLEPPAG